MKKFLSFLSLLSLMIFASANSFAQGQIIDVNEENFPDPHFRKIVINNVAGKDEKISPSEILNCESLSGFANGGIKSLKGIEYFTNLKEIDFAQNKISYVDLSQNKALEKISLFSNTIHTLILPNTNTLKTLRIAENALSSLDLKPYTELEYLNASNNPLSDIDLSTNTKLKDLSLASCKLKSLDLNKNVELLNIELSDNRLSSLDLKNQPLLDELYAVGNSLLSLDLSSNENISYCQLNPQKIRLEVSANAQISIADLIKSDISNIKNIEMQGSLRIENGTISNISNNDVLTYYYSLSSKQENIKPMLVEVVFAIK